jgi:hypothetical protein
MAKELFVAWDPEPETLAVVKRANRLVDEYRRQGFTLTLRQIYYQFVSKNLFPADRRWTLTGNNKWERDPQGTPNATPNYKWLAEIINRGRLAGLIDWAAFEDRLRNVERPAVWDSPTEILEAVAAQYQRNPWDDQKYRPEVWIEKDALGGVIEPVCKRWRVPFLACRGYMSQSEQYAAGKRFAGYIDDGRIPIVLHLGDHDPSGLNMTDDNRGRLAMFAESDVEIRRLALNMDQVRQFNPPPNPAKETDSRFASYSEQFGDESWELDALEPRTINDIIEHELRGLIDMDAWGEVMAKEKTDLRALSEIADDWEAVCDFLGVEKEPGDD